MAKKPHASHMLWGPEIIHVNPFVSVFVGPGSNSSHIDIFCELGKKAKLSRQLGNCMRMRNEVLYRCFCAKKYVGSGVNVESVKVTTD